MLTPSLLRIVETQCNLALVSSSCCEEGGKIPKIPMPFVKGRAKQLGASEDAPNIAFQIWVKLRLLVGNGRFFTAEIVEKVTVRRQYD